MHETTPKGYEDSDSQETLSAASLFRLLPATLHIRFRQNNINIHKLATQTGLKSLGNVQTHSPTVNCILFHNYIILQHRM
jgi:hypothetical protein